MSADRPSRSLPIVAVLAAPLYGLLAAREDPSISVEAPAHVYELAGGYAVWVHGEGILDGPPTIRVFEGSNEISSQVTVALDDETRVDSDADGILEDYEGDFTVSFGSYEPDPGDVLRVEVWAPSSRCIAASDTTEVRSHVDVSVDGRIDFGATEVDVGVFVRELFVDSVSLRVLLDSTDVTSLVTITRPETVYESLEAGTPPFVRLRSLSYEVDVSLLGEFQGRLVFAATASGTGRGGVVAGESTGTNSSVGEYRFEPQDPGPRDAVLVGSRSRCASTPAPTRCSRPTRRISASA